MVTSQAIGRLVAAAILAVLGGSAVGCAQQTQGLPPGISVAAFQTRFDYGLRQLELKVANDGTGPITVNTATFTSTYFTEPAVWDRPQKIAAGSAVDLRVVLPQPDCATNAPATHQVTLDLLLPDGTRAKGDLRPTDEQGRLEVIHTEDCLNASVDKHADITPADKLAWTPGQRAPARLDLIITPTTEDGSLRIESAGGTVLFSLVGDGGTAVSQVPVNLSITPASPTTTITLSVVPARCDPHAIEEDKRGTFFPLTISTTQAPAGTVYIAVSDDLRRSLYEFYADYCSLP